MQSSTEVRNVLRLKSSSWEQTWRRCYEAAAEVFEWWPKCHQISCARMTDISSCNLLRQLLQTVRFFSNRHSRHPRPRY
ncbi:unnamed protein product [Symbiodinium necroappetens]|uniref:Uncharacterized protein n=1 Tax=Symbiodinium necroappetens TaxID=1628268 RepID=A0A812NKU1_9DINO|nr:unnamed protein product [Symbiodinium necroappetens]